MYYYRCYYYHAHSQGFGVQVKLPNGWGDVVWKDVVWIIMADWDMKQK